MNYELDIDTLRARGNKPRVHPNGFIQLDLDTQSRRLHVWPDASQSVLGQNSSSPLHDHIFHMQSTVHRGSLTQLRFDVDLNHFGRPTHEIFIADYLKQSESVLKPTGVLGVVNLNNYKCEAVAEGELYWQPPFTFHDTQPGRTPLVTIMQKGTIYKEHNSRVLVPVGEEPDNNFRRDQYSESYLWEIIEDALQM